MTTTRPVSIADSYAHLTKRVATNLVPGQVGKGARRLLLGRLDTGKVFPFFINGDLVTLANIKKYRVMKVNAARDGVFL